MESPKMVNTNFLLADCRFEIRQNPDLAFEEGVEGMSGRFAALSKVRQERYENSPTACCQLQLCIHLHFDSPTHNVST
jgi:hypothetical protein